MVVIETTYVRLVYYSDMGCLLIKWLSKPDTAVLMEEYMHLLKLATINVKPQLYCTDLSSIGALDQEQEVWLNVKYYPMAYDLIQNDIYVAVVFSEAHFKAIVSHYQPSSASSHYSFLHFTYFTDLVEAMHWLRSLKKGQDAASFPAAP